MPPSAKSCRGWKGQNDLIKNDLIRIDHAENAVGISLGSSRVIELVGVAIRGRASAKLNPPKTTDMDRLALAVGNGPNQCASSRIESVDGA